MIYFYIVLFISSILFSLQSKNSDKIKSIFLGICLRFVLCLEDKPKN